MEMTDLITAIAVPQTFEILVLAAVVVITAFALSFSAKSKR